MRRAGVGVEIRFDVGHLLVRGDGFIQTALFHQNIAEQTEIKSPAAHRREFAGQRFGVLETMQALQNMAAQQERFGLVRLLRFERERALFGQLVITGIETRTRPGHVGPAQLFQGEFDVFTVANLLLQAGNFLCGTVVAGLG